MREHYTDVLERIKITIPSPISNPVADGYFVHTISKFLDLVDSLKSSLPMLTPADPESLQHAKDLSSLRFPEDLTSVEDLVPMLAEYCKGVTIWSHPNAQANVIPPPTIPSIISFVAAAIYNPNIISDEYSARFADAEKESVAMLADLLGYIPGQAGGLFTFGGTGTILYGLKLAVEKVLNGRGMIEGVREDFKVVASSSAHYACKTAVSWLGLGTRNLILVPSMTNNEMSISLLEKQLRELFSQGTRVAAIVATVGTTDAFGIDDVAAIVQVRDRLVVEYSLSYRPHVHADAVIGWAWAVFRDYDFELNPLGFHARTIRSLLDCLPRIDALRFADSIGIDFHKTGYVPYISSVVMVKEKDTLTMISRAPEEMPYLYQVGRYHPGQFTLETSRAGSGALATLANIHLLGKQGYRVLLGHCVEMAEMLRERLEHHADICVMNDMNFGPVTLFRLYSKGVDGQAARQREISDPKGRIDLLRNNQYNKKIFARMHERVMRGEGVLLSWTAGYCHAKYENGPPIAAIKSFIMSPWTDFKAINTVVQQVLEARAQITDSW